MRNFESKVLNCWDSVVGFLSSWHKDAVANVVVYSSIALAFGVVAIGMGAASYVMLDLPCQVSENSDKLQYVMVNDVAVGQIYRDAMNSCLLMIGFVFSTITVAVAALGIAAGELNKRQLYNIYGTFSFVSAFIEAVALVSVLAILVEHRERLTKTETILNAISAVSHGICLLAMMLNIRYSWYIYNAFSKQDREIFEEKRRKEFENIGETKSAICKATVQLMNLFGALGALPA